MDDMRQYNTPPPYAYDNHPYESHDYDDDYDSHPYDNQHYGNHPYDVNHHNERPPYDEDFDDKNYYSNNNNNYNSRINPDDTDPYYTTPSYKNDGGFPTHYEYDYNSRPYGMSFWVRYFRYIPHLNLTFNRVNDTFNPKSPVYQESMGMIGCVPAGLLLLTLLVLLLYLLTRCCDHKPRSRCSIICCKVACILSSILTLGVVGVSVWGSMEVHNGVDAALKQALTPITGNLLTLHSNTDLLTNQVRHHLQPQLSLFHESLQSNEVSNVTVKEILLDQLHYMKTNISEVLLINVEDIAAKMRDPTLNNLNRQLDVFELGRSATTITVAALLMLSVLVLVIGVAMHSRAVLITFSVLGLLSLIICFCLTSMYLVSTVALADWCVEPEGVALESWLSTVFPRRVAQFYLHCNDHGTTSPFTRHLSRAQQSARSVLDALKDVKNIADQYYPRELVHPSLDHVTAYVNQSQRSLATVAILLECQPQHQYFMLMAHYMCTTTMNGMVYLLLSAIGSALMFTLLVWLASHTWIYLNSKAESGTAEESDPFLPGGSRGGVTVAGPNVGGGGGSRAGTLNSISGGGSGGGRGARHSHTPPQTPPFPGTLNGRMYNNQHQHYSHTLGHHHKSEGGMNGGRAPGAPPPYHHTATMPRESHSHSGHSHSHSHGQAPPVGPNQGQYATLSKQCKTLESSDFY